VTVKLHIFIASFGFVMGLGRWSGTICGQ